MRVDISIAFADQGMSAIEVVVVKGKMFQIRLQINVT